MGNSIKIRELIRHDVWKNYEISAWVDRTFKTHEEKMAAWEMFAHLSNEYPGVSELVRGQLIKTEESIGG